MQPANKALRLQALAVSLRRRSPWEAIDLGLAMLQRWWRAVYVPHLAVGGALAAAVLLFSWYVERPWVAIVAVWWMKPLYDRVVLHVLSRAVFGELQPPRAVLGAWREWLAATGLSGAIVLRWLPDLARSFNLPVRQLEGQAGKSGRERRGVLGRRARSDAVSLTLVCMGFEVVLYLMLGGLADLALPAKAAEGQNFREMIAAGNFFSYGGAIGYAATVLLLEPFYVAAGFGLYLNRRTLLEGWDIEVALRRLAERHATAAVLFFSLFCFLAMPTDSYAEQNPKQEMAEVLKAKEFGYERDATRWQSRNPDKPPGKKSDFDPKALWGIGYALARVAEVLLWGLAAAAVAYALWFLARMLPGRRAPAPEPYRPPPALFGMELAPETLPPDVAAAAAALAREGKLREALSLLYRGALSNLVHQRGVQLLASHTEAEVLSLSGHEVHSYLEKLIAIWRLCAYARRDPAPADIEQLALGYRASFA
jgi:hypothetical protein